MVYLTVSQAWLDESLLLLQARPNTARVTTTYTPNPPQKKRKLNPRRHKQDADKGAEKNSQKDAANTTESEGEAPAPPATLTMKTFDPASGVCLKYKTQKQQEVGRLIGVGGLAGIARVMAGEGKPNVSATAEGQAEAGKEADEDGDTRMEGSAVADETVGTVEQEKPAGYARAKKSVSFASGVEVHKAPQEQQGKGGGGGGGEGKKKKKGGKGR